MSQILNASCIANVVTVEGKPVHANILSEGVKASTGLALIESDNVNYVTSNASDIKDLISSLTTLIQLVSDTFTAIGTGMTGPTTAPPASLPASIVALALIKTTLTTMGNTLK